MPADPTPTLRPLRLRLASAARTLGKPQYILEKDYALSYLVAAIAGVRALREVLVFKGGTCLRKTYFRGYRFSEDLDFTARWPSSCPALMEALLVAGDGMREQLLPHGPFEILVTEEQHRRPHERGQCSFRVRVRFPWMRHPDCSLKVEVSNQEPLLIGPVERPLIHEFPGETLQATIATYHLEEIAAEKLRAFLQRRQHLRERGWLRSRPRDLYDLWYLHGQNDHPIDWQQVGTLLPAKAEAYGLAYRGPRDLLDEPVLRGIERDWEVQLGPFVGQLPPFHVALEALRTILHAISR